MSSARTAVALVLAVLLLAGQGADAALTAVPQVRVCPPRRRPRLAHVLTLANAPGAHLWPQTEAGKRAAGPATRLTPPQLPPWLLPPLLPNHGRPFMCPSVPLLPPPPQACKYKFGTDLNKMKAALAATKAACSFNPLTLKLTACTPACKQKMLVVNLACVTAGAVAYGGGAIQAAVVKAYRQCALGQRV